MKQGMCGRITRRKTIELGRKSWETETEVTSLQTSRRHSLFSWASSSHQSPVHLLVGHSVL